VFTGRGRRDPAGCQVGLFGVPPFYDGTTIVRRPRHPASGPAGDPGGEAVGWKTYCPQLDLRSEDLGLSPFWARVAIPFGVPRRPVSAAVGQATEAVAGPGA